MAWFVGDEVRVESGMARLIVRCQGRKRPAKPIVSSSQQIRGVARRMGKTQLLRVLLRPGAPRSMTRKFGFRGNSSHSNGAFDAISAKRR
jgi:hypothetical protein